MKTLSLASVATMFTLSLTGCFAPGMSGGEDVGDALQADETWNSLTANSLTANSLTANSLTANSLTANSLTADALTDPAARDVLKYIVGCALPAGTDLAITIGGTAYDYPGQLGLAPQWGQSNGRCDGNCVAAVSSCVLGRLNYLGQVVDISMRGAPPLTTSQAEIAAYPQVDGVYYGNIFSSPQIRLACLPPGVTELTRVCGPSLSGCVVTSVGECTDVCQGMRADYSAITCSDKAGKHSTSYNFPVTIFLQ